MPTLIFNSIRLGISYAMDAFSVSLSNGLSEPCMSKKKICGVAGTFAVFQAIMPLIGWLCVYELEQIFEEFERFIPWIALVLLCFIGIKMIYESATCKEEEGCKCTKVGFGSLMVQGVATSIDALSGGFAMSDYNPLQALICALIISAITFAICVAGVIIGKKAGTKLSKKAGYLGGIILIIIGLEIFIKGAILKI